VAYNSNWRVTRPDQRHYEELNLFNVRTPQPFDLYVTEAVVSETKMFTIIILENNPQFMHILC